MSKTRIGIIGLHQSGKSLLINCLIKRAISKVGSGCATTHVPVTYSYSEDEYAEYFDMYGSHIINPEDVAKHEDNESIDKINVYLDNSLLKAFTLVDLPGTGFNAKDNKTMARFLSELDFAILLATDVKEYTSSSSFYTNTLQLLQEHQIPYYFAINCINLTRWSPKNKQNIEIAKSDIELLQKYEPLSLGENIDYPLVNLMWYWCSQADPTDELYLKYYESVLSHFEQKGKKLSKQTLEDASNFHFIKGIFDHRNRLYLELKCDFRRELNRIKKEICPIGTIQAFAFESIPHGWLLCNGQGLKIVDYPELFNAIGVTFGGDGKTKFRVPDLRSKFVRGWDKRNRKFGSDQDDALQGHTHDFHLDAIKVESSGRHDHDLYWGEFYLRDPSIFSDNNHRQYISVRYVDRQQRLIGRIDTDYLQQDGSAFEGEHSHELKVDSSKKILGIPVESSYGSMHNKIDKETRPKNIALSYCIKAKH